jgi:pimeloyl-ACP methyl ester carboxylesterase
MIRFARAALMATAMFVFVPPSWGQGNSAPPAQPQPQLQPLGINLEELAYPHPVQFLDLEVDGQALRMAYMDVAPSAQPNGKTVLLLHGKSFSGFYWESSIKMLRAAGYRVIVPDQLGFGKSSKLPALPYSFDLLTAATAKLLDQLHIDRCVVAGHSFGGMLAVYFARTYPERISHLVLENPIGLEDYRAVVPPQPGAALLKVEMSLSTDGYRNFLKNFFASWKPEYEVYVDVFARLRQSPDYPRFAKASAQIYQMIYQQPIRHEYPLIKVPALLIIGQADRSAFFRRFAPPEATSTLGNWPALGKQAAKDIPGAKLVEIFGAGHVPHVETPELFEKALLEFIKPPAADTNGK